MNYATYCPEDNKLRLYVGRVPREEYLKLKEEGWTSTPKQDCDFVATWTPTRYATALEYGDGTVEDEDQGPEDRAADRAERFGGYLDKRLSEATGHADAYEAGPTAHGFQSQAKAERAAARHDRIGSKAYDAWSKAEYWQQRTAGVISHALYVSSPSVRMGRIKTLEAELRQLQSRYTPQDGQKIMQRTDDGEEQVPFVWCGQGHGGFWVQESKLEAIKRGCEQWENHLQLRLSYERQMLEAQGGRLGDEEIEVGGKLGGRLIWKVNKSSVSGRVTSVSVLGPKVEGWTYKASNLSGTEFAEHQIDTERLAPGAYTPPTPETLAELEAIKSARKAAAPKKDACPLINPTDEDAERLVNAWNERRRDAHKSRPSWEEFKPIQIVRVTQETYSNASKGSYARASTSGLCADMELEDPASDLYSESRAKRKARIGKPLCKVRVTGYNPTHLLILTDKPQKPLPASVWQPIAQEVIA